MNPDTGSEKSGRRPATRRTAKSPEEREAASKKTRAPRKGTSSPNTPRHTLDAEWLETDGLGGFASGTVGGARTRRYHALLLASTTPPTGRFVLVNGFEAWVETATGSEALSTQRYAPDVVHPDGATRLVGFESDPWPAWRYRLDDGTEIVQELFVTHGAPRVILRWSIARRSRRRATSAAPSIRLFVRPLLSGRDTHALQRENNGFSFDAKVRGTAVRWCAYDGVPAVVAHANGAYRHAPDWFRNFLYDEERARGLDCIEDLGSPGVFSWDLAAAEALWVLEAEGVPRDDAIATPDEGAALVVWASRARDAEKRRRAGFASRLDRAADHYLARRGNGRTILAGFPWFTDWGRDTFIAIRGLCLAGDRLDDAGAILLEWAGVVSEGMLPNLFPDHGDRPEYNAVDASLWYVIAAHEYLEALEAAGRGVASARAVLGPAIAAILDGFSRGTRYGIHADDDGLLAAGEPGVQLTWMDAKIGDWVVTPRIGKPVEVQALWLNALAIGATFEPRWRGAFEKGHAAFATRFWNDARQCLFDVVDPDHRRGEADATMRPNQIFAVGGLPVALLDGARARAVVDAVEDHLWTPLGLRSLAPGEPDYRPRYEGGVWERDSAYHQGTVWPWLIGGFVQAWVRVRGGGDDVKVEARERFVMPLLAHLDQAGIGHVSEIADADPPFTPRGCPFQAWSVGELMRLERWLAVPAPTRARRPARAALAHVPTGGR